MEQRNLILAIALSVAILLGFQYFFEHPRLQHEAAQRAQHTEQKAAGGGAAKAPSAAPPAGAPAAPTAAPAGAAPAGESRDAALAAAPRIKIDTPRLHGSIALVGGRLDDLTLAQYHETVDPKSPEIVLLSPAGTASPYFVESGWAPADKSVKVPDSDTKWNVTGEALTTKTPVTLTWDNGAGLRFTRTISVDDDYMFTVEQKVENHSGAPVTLYPYASVTRIGTPPSSSYYILFEGMIGNFNGILKEEKYSALKPGEPVTATSPGAWLGFTDKYWLTALVPPQDETVKGRFTHTLLDHTDRYQADFLGSEKIVPAGGSIAASSRLFAGPKVVKLLDKYRDELGINSFDNAVDWGWFYFLTKPIFFALDFFYGVIGNFGLAILLLTVLVKLLFFPLANKSYKAMSKMKLLQPEMMKLREKFGDDKQRLNEEMMALYKRVGANPLAGCLPIVVQIPVFFSLYKVLYVTIEMRQAPFYGWIRDLSAPDPTSFANLFGLIPWHPPAFLMIGAWPLIMGATMFLQQKLNPQPADPVQAKMFMFLPIMFTYMLASFPAGLVIYWAWNNTLSVIQQWVIMHRAGAA
ncbi:MAG TPA: membrane protein insertase YidC [Stellaceae bacterium]|nr:membrane protein insertase YidC [Stellaceae bacterium]